MKKGSEFQATVESLAYGGHGICRIENFVVFVRGALPGQTIKARIVRKKSSYAEARLLEVLSESPFAVPPRCVHFGSCGGCLLQHFDYEKQCDEKYNQVKDLLQRVGGLQDFEMLPTLPAQPIYNYRNKIEFSFSRDRWLSPEEIASNKEVEKTGLYLGFHAKGFFNKVIDIQECHLTDPVATRILREVREIAQNSGLPVYSTQDHQGFWRFLVVRPAFNTGDLVVNVVTSRFDKTVVAELKNRLTTEFPQITSLINGITKSKSSVAYTEEEFVLFGEPTIEERLGPYRFQISANSFFQTNTRQAKVLYDVALEFAEFDGDELVYDLYCGAGSISIYISEHVDKVVGFESVGSAVENARQNCRLNDVQNCQFVLGDLKDQLNDTEQVLRDYGQPDVIILDPPRGGMHPKTVQAVLNLQPERIVHVSCNPATMARELQVLTQDYRLTKVQPVDMFPHTAHIEVVAQLVKK